MVNRSDELKAIENVEKFILKTAGRYSRGSDTRLQDLAQEGRLAALKAYRTWMVDSKTTAKLHSYCIRNVWWTINAICMKERREWEHTLELDRPAPSNEGEIDSRESFWLIDETAINAELALIAEESFAALSEGDQEIVLERLEGLGRGRPRTLSIEKAGCTGVT